MDAEERARLRALADAATPGPWEHVDYAGSADPETTYRGCGSVISMGEDTLGGHVAAPDGDLYPRSGYNPKADMAFVAAVREAVPALLDAMDAAEARIAALTEESVQR